MIRHIDADVEKPPSRTPAEWRDIAITAGLPADAVETITATFRAVQYGDEPETVARRQRVRDALTKLEARREDTDD